MAAFAHPDPPKGPSLWKPRQVALQMDGDDLVMRSSPWKSSGGTASLSLLRAQSERDRQVDFTPGEQARQAIDPRYEHDGPHQTA